jgi:formylglycine-generating enzyme required for sulfatase activity
MNRNSESTISSKVEPPNHDGKSSTLRNVRVFLCYRRNDGAWYAEWLNEHLSEAEFTDSGGSGCRIRTYYDKTAPGVADWKSLHFPSLQASQALVLVCTPGIAKDLSKRGRPDWVYEELRWWIRNRLTSPIVIDATGEGDRWLPEIIGRKWPNINRIDLDKGQAEAAVTSGDTGFADRVRERVIGAIRQSEKATVFEDLERYKRLTRGLRLALICSLVLLVGIIAGLVGWINQGYLTGQWRWYTAVRPFLAANILPHVLTAEAERALKPGDTFRECTAEQETQRGWLGVRIQQVTDETADTLGIKPAHGALVAGMDDRGPAKNIIEPGDVIVQIDGKDIKEMRDLPRVVADTPVGKDVPVVIIRKGKEDTKTVKLGQLRESKDFCPEMIVVPAGSFVMGSPPSEKEHSPREAQHQVTIAKAFAVSKYQLTFDEWDTCVAYEGCNGQRLSDSSWGRGGRPVINVLWDDAQQYVAWLSRVTGKAYRLLTEAEYEYATRAGTKTVYPWGDDIRLNGKAMANCSGCGSQWDSHQTAPVGSFAANGFGLYDMVGNAMEWTEDCFHNDYTGAPTDGSAWIEGADCTYHVVRGGAWGTTPQYLRSAFRSWNPLDRHNAQGFRVARTLLSP